MTSKPGDSRSRGIATPRHASSIPDLDLSDCGADGPLTVRTRDVTCGACRSRIAARALSAASDLELTLAEAVELLWSGVTVSR